MPTKDSRHAAATTAGMWPEGFVDFYQDRYATMVRLAALIVGRLDVAEEVIQDVIVEMAPRWETIENPAGYLRTAVVNRSRSVLRRGRREVMQQESSLHMAVEDAETPADLSAMWQALADLSPRRRAAVVLRFYEDLTDTEIARVLGCRDTTVRSLVHRALRQLEKELS